MAKLTEADLLTLPKYVENGKKSMSYSYVLGKCQGKMCGKAQQGHASVTDITATFAKDLCGWLASPVEEHLATEPPTTQGQYSGGQAQKPFKETA